MFRKIAFPTDFSEGSVRAINKFAEEKILAVNKHIILYVIDEGQLKELLTGYSFLYNNGERKLSDVNSEIKRKSKKKLKIWEEQCKELLKFFNVSTRILVECLIRRLSILQIKKMSGDYNVILWKDWILS